MYVIACVCVCVCMCVCECMFKAIVPKLLSYPTCREIKILKKLQHKNVISLIETFEDPEKQKLYPSLN